MSDLPDLSTLERAAALVHAVMPATPQYLWPQLTQAVGSEVWVKHENHTPTGAFKVRGGLTYFEALSRREPRCAGVVSATRGNHGQSVGFAAARHGLGATIVVPHGNSREKNAAMRALGVTLIEWGEDFQEAREHAAALARREGLHLIPSYHEDLVAGVASYWLEFLQAVPDLSTLIVPIGMGSGICAAIAAREALRRRIRIIGVVSAHADAYARAFESRVIEPVAANTRIADGMACRLPDPKAMELIWRHVDEIVRVDDEAVIGAMRLLYTATHNLAEGAGAASLAAALQMRARLQGERVGIVLTGGNVDLEVFLQAVGAVDASVG